MILDRRRCPLLEFDVRGRARVEVSGVLVRRSVIPHPCLLVFKNGIFVGFPDLLSDCRGWNVYIFSLLRPPSFFFSFSNYHTRIFFFFIFSSYLIPMIILRKDDLVGCSAAVIPSFSRVLRISSVTPASCTANVSSRTRYPIC